MFPTASRASHLPPTHWKDHAPGKVAPDAESVGQLGSIERDVELQPPIQILDAPCPHRESDTAWWSIQIHPKARAERAKKRWLEGESSLEQGPVHK